MRSFAEKDKLTVGINACLYGQYKAGVEKCIYHLVKTLPEVDGDTNYYTYIRSGNADFAALQRYGITLRATIFPHSGRMVRIGWEQLMLPYLLVKDRVDLFHAPAYIAPFCCPKPFIVTIYDLIALLFPELCRRTNSMYFRLSLSSVAHRAKRIITPSHTTRKDLLEYLQIPEEKVVVIPPGLDNRFLMLERNSRLRLKREKLRSQYGLPEKFILFVGNLEPKKNLVCLLKAFHRLRRGTKVRHKLVLTGQKAWNYQDIFTSVESLTLSSEVIFTNYVADDDLPFLYRMADLFVFPSLYEGFGLPPLEAMACGVPVVCSNSGSLPEVVGKAALTVPPDDVTGLTESMYRALSCKKLRQRLIRKGLKRARLFSWEKTALKTVELYQTVYREVVSERKRPRENENRLHCWSIPLSFRNVYPERGKRIV